MHNKNSDEIKNGANKNKLISHLEIHCHHWTSLVTFQSRQNWVCGFFFKSALGISSFMKPNKCMWKWKKKIGAKKPTESHTDKWCARNQIELMIRFLFIYLIFLCIAILSYQILNICMHYIRIKRHWTKDNTRENAIWMNSQQYDIWNGFRIHLRQSVSPIFCFMFGYKNACQVYTL